jgi:hypothetical protein
MAAVVAVANVHAKQLGLKTTPSLESISGGQVDRAAIIASGSFVIFEVTDGEAKELLASNPGGNNSVTWDFTHGQTDAQPTNLGPNKVWYTGTQAQGQENPVYVTISRYDTEDMKYCKTGKKITCAVIVPKIETSVTLQAPSDKSSDRKKLGVAEEVKLSIVPDSMPATSTQWIVTSGSTDNPTGQQVTYTAPNKVTGFGTSTVTATVSGIEVKTQFTVVEPQSQQAVVIAKNTNDCYPSDHTPPAADEAGVAMKLTVTVQPTDVSFANVAVKEFACVATNRSGVFASGSISNHKEWANWGNLNSQNQWTDQAGGGFGKFTFGQGSFEWNIPAKWRVKTETSGSGNSFSNGNVQIFTMATGTSGEMTVNKLGAHASRTPTTTTNQSAK